MAAWDETFDYVVVGSGAGSMVAGMVMRKAGRTSLVLEKEAVVGGTTARSGGVMWVPNNPLLAKDGMGDTPEKAAAYLDGVLAKSNALPGASPERRRAFISEGPKMVQFLIDEGLKFRRYKHWPDYFDQLPGATVAGRSIGAELFNVNELGPWKDKLRAGYTSIPARLSEGQHVGGGAGQVKAKLAMLKIGIRGTLAAITGKQWATAGRALQGRMLQAALKAGVEVRTEAPVKEIIVEDGAVTGVVAEIGGKTVRIKAELGVLINAGGFAHNQRLRDKYMPGTKTEWSVASKADTGEIIEEAMRIGAATAQMGERVGQQVTLPPDNTSDFIPMIQTNIAKPHAFMVDQTGVRFMNEGGSYTDFARNMLKRNETVPAVPCWMIFDSQYTSKYMLAGTLPGSPQQASWVKQGYLRKADSVEDLARQLNIEPAALKATVERFNGLARAGKDSDFNRGIGAYDQFLGDLSHKPSPALGTVEKGPFFALPVFPGDVSTFGGVVADAKARVLREDGTVIKGLYATGASSASVMGDNYAGAGSSIGPTMTWGYVAARDALSANY